MRYQRDSQKSTSEVFGMKQTQIDFSQDKREIDLSIIMLAYNQEKYIEQAIESVLMQETEYRYELLIGEDCSSDRTREIVLSYQQKYPEKIRIILHDKNVGMFNNVRILGHSVFAEYVAYLEGDDCWTDKEKIQKQLSFLKNNEQYIGSAHNVYLIDKEGKKWNSKKRYSWTGRSSYLYNLKKAQKGDLAGHVSSLMFRNIYTRMSERQFELYDKCVAVGDYKLSVTLACFGNVFFGAEYMSAYRRVFDEESWTSRASKKNMSEFFYMQSVATDEYVKMAYGIKFNSEQIALHHTLRACEIFMERPTKENLRILCAIWKDKHLSTITKMKYVIVQKKPHMFK